MTSRVNRFDPARELSNLFSLASGLIVLAFASLVLIAYLDDRAGGGDLRRQVLESLPAFPTAKLVTEYDLETADERALVRQYAIPDGSVLAINAVTDFYRAILISDGWQEDEARASFSSFRKGDSQLILGRAGSEMQAAPPVANVTYRGESPDGTSFYFTLEAIER